MKNDNEIWDVLGDSRKRYRVEQITCILSRKIMLNAFAFSSV